MKCAYKILWQECADVFADAVFDFDIEAGFGGNFKMFAGAVLCRTCRFTIQFYVAFTGNDLHAFGGVRAEMELAGVNEPEGFARVIGQQDCVADDFAVEIDVGFGNRGRYR